MHNVAYNRHKLNNALNFQDVAASDGLVLHIAGPIEIIEYIGQSMYAVDCNNLYNAYFI